jgi:hypothetical protein
MIRTFNCCSCSVVTVSTFMQVRSLDHTIICNWHWRPRGNWILKLYMVRQFNSRNGPVIAEFSHLCTNGCCRLRNTLFVKLCTSWDDVVTAGKCLENRFPEYLAVIFSRCVECQKSQQIFVPSGHISILERAKNRSGLSRANKVDGPIL